MMTFRHLSSLRIYFKWPHNNLSGPEADELLQLERVSLNSSFEKMGQGDINLSLISSRMLALTWQWSALLNVEWRACHRFSILRHWQSSYLIDSMAGNLHLLTQLISSQGPRFLFAISWIFWSKKAHLVDLTVLLKIFQFSKLLDDL